MLRKLKFPLIISLMIVLLLGTGVPVVAADADDYAVSLVGSIGNQFTPKYNPGDGNFWTMTTAGFDTIGKITPAGLFTVVDPFVGGGGGSSPEMMQMLQGMGTKGMLYVADTNYGGNWWTYNAATGAKTAISRPWYIPGTSGPIFGMATDGTGTKLYHHLGDKIKELNAVTGVIRDAVTNSAFAASSNALSFLEYDGFTDTLIGLGINAQNKSVLYRINVNNGITTNIPLSTDLPSLGGIIPDASTGLLYAFPGTNPNGTIYEIDPITGNYQQVDLGAGTFLQFSTFGPARTGTGKSLYGLAGTYPSYKVVEIAGPYPFQGSVPQDVTPPVIVPAVEGTVGNDGWYTSNVTVSWTVTDGESEVTSIIGGETTAITEDMAGVTLTCEATSAGGTASASVTVKRDATAPVVSASKSPEPNSYGWNNTDVTVQFTASDALSGIDLFTPAIIVTAEGIDQSVTGTAADAAGNVASVTETGINIDKTPPVITYTGNAGTYSIDQMVNITCSATDALSGVSSDTCQNIIGPAYSFPGVNSFSSEAIDQAGNSANASTSFNVQVSYDGLRKLVKKFVTKQGIINSLLAKLNAAEAADARGNNGAADNIMNAFINELEAQTGKSISPEQASILIKLVEAL